MAAPPVGDRTVTFARKAPTGRLPSQVTWSHELEPMMSATPAVPERKRPRMATEDRQAQVVAKAAELFHLHGYSQTSMEDIADAVGVAKPTLYHHFRSKDVILVEIHQEVSRVLRKRHGARVDAGVGPTGLLFGIISDLLELTETHPAHQHVWIEHERELPDGFKQERRGQIEEYRGIVEEQIRRCIDEGSLRPVDVRLTAMQIMGMSTWAYRWLRAEGYHAHDVALIFWDNLRIGIGTPGSGS